MTGFSGTTQEGKIPELHTEKVGAFSPNLLSHLTVRSTKQTHENTRSSQLSIAEVSRGRSVLNTFIQTDSRGTVQWPQSQHAFTFKQLKYGCIDRDIGRFDKLISLLISGRVPHCFRTLTWQSICTFLIEHSFSSTWQNKQLSSTPEGSTRIST